MKDEDLKRTDLGRVLQFASPEQQQELDQNKNWDTYFRSVTTTLTETSLLQRPKPKRFVCNYFPIGYTSALVGSGGAGKTTFVAHEILKALLDDDKLQVAIVTSEDDVSDYQEKFHSLIFSNHDDKNQVEFSNVTRIQDRIHIVNARGSGQKLVQMHNGCFIPSAYSVQIGQFIRRQHPNVRLVVFETVSRFAGGEENERLEAFVSACDGIAQIAKLACVAVHHTGKQAARDAQENNEVIDIYMGRNGSVFGDNTRSFVYVSPLSRDDAKDLNCDLTIIEEKRGVTAHHVRSSYSTRQPKQHLEINQRDDGVGIQVSQLELLDPQEKRLAAEQYRKRRKASIDKVILEYIEAEINDNGFCTKRSISNGTKQTVGYAKGVLRDHLDHLLLHKTLEEFTQISSKGQEQTCLRVVGKLWREASE